LITFADYIEKLAIQTSQGDSRLIENLVSQSAADSPENGYASKTGKPRSPLDS
jgi:hypothetical protein